MGSINEEFELAEANASDMDDIINVIILAFATDETWKYMFEHVPFYARYRLIREYFGSRYGMDDITCFKITEKATGYGYWCRTVRLTRLTEIGKLLHIQHCSIRGRSDP
jgi:hypothetical protein